MVAIARFNRNNWNSFNFRFIQWCKSVYQRIPKGNYDFLSDRDRKK